MGRYRLAVDTGGTFSDFVLYDEQTGELHVTKLPSTPENPGDAILGGMDELSATLGIGADELTGFVHDTTVATNALLETRERARGC